MLPWSVSWRRGEDGYWERLWYAVEFEKPDGSGWGLWSGWWWDTEVLLGCWRFFWIVFLWKNIVKHYIIHTSKKTVSNLPCRGVCVGRTDTVRRAVGNLQWRRRQNAFYEAPLSNNVVVKVSDNLYKKRLALNACPFDFRFVRLYTSIDFVFDFLYLGAFSKKYFRNLDVEPSRYVQEPYYSKIFHTLYIYVYSLYMFLSTSIVRLFFFLELFE